MSDFKELFGLVKQGEGQKLDYKLAISNLHKIAKTIVSFANTDGGVIVVGVDDKGDFIGIDAAQEKYMLIKAARKFCDPPVYLYFRELRAKGKNFLIARIEKSKINDHRALDEQGLWLPYVRVKDQSILLPGIDKQHLLDKHNLDPIPILMDKNRGLIHYLEQNESISIKDYMRMMNISYSIAKRSLLELTSHGILEVEEINHRPHYFLVHDQ